MGRLLLFCLSLLHVACAQFVNPGAAGVDGEYRTNLNFTVGSKEILEWENSFSSWRISLFQDNHIGGNGTIISNGISSSGGAQPQRYQYEWTVESDLDYVRWPQFFFVVFDETEGSDLRTGSHYFNMTAPISSTTTSSSTSTRTPTSTSTQTESSITGNVPAATTSGPAQTSDTSGGGDSSGFSTGAKVGVGVAVPIAVIALLAGGFILGRRHMSKKKDTGYAGEEMRSAGMGISGELPPKYGGENHFSEMPDTPFIAQEVPADDRVHRHELAGEEVLSGPDERRGV